MASINYYAGISMNGSNIEMNKNQLLQPVIETGTGLPATGISVVGQMFYDNTTNLMYFFNGTAWIEMDGSGSGVSSLTIANAGVNAGGVNTSLVIDATTSANTLQPMQFGGSANIGMVPDASGGTDSAKFLRGDGTWQTADNYNAWKLQASTGTEFSVVEGATVSFAVSSGSGITTAVSNPTGIVGLLQISMDVSSLTTAVPVATDFIAFSDESATDDPTRKVTIANLLSLAPQGDVTKVTPSIEIDELGIVIVNPDGPIPEVGFSVVSLAAASSVASTDQLLLVSGTGQNSTNKKVSVSDLVAAGDTTYDLISTTSAANFVAIKLDASSGAAGDSNVNFRQASDNNVTLTRIANGDIELGFSDNIDIGGTLEVANSSTFIGAVSMEDTLTMEASIFMDDNKITSLADGTASGDAVNLGQVQALVAGVGIFRGGYDASTGLTTDLGAGNGAINGASNIATDLGDFYAVTVSGTQLGLTLEPGDLIFANVAIAASSSPANSAFTVVQSGQSVATAASTDNAAVKGIAGFDSATFTVSGTGWVQSVVYSGTSNIGVVPSGGDATKFLRGDGTWVVPTNSGGTITSVVQSSDNDLLGINVSTVGTTATVGLSINGLTALGAAPATGDTLPIFDLTASPSVNRKVTVQNLTSAHQRDTTFSGTLSAYGSITHGLGSFDVIVQLYDETSFKTIYMDIERDSVNTVVLSGSGTFPGDVKVLVTKIG